MNTMTRSFLALLLCLRVGPLLAQQAPQYAQIAPLLGARCVLCHNGPAAPLGLQLDSLEGVLKGSARGPVVKPGNAEESELIRRIKGISQPRMPMTGPPWLSEAEIALLQGWVDGGLQAGPSVAQVPANASPMVAATKQSPDQTGAVAQPAKPLAVTIAADGPDDPKVSNPPAPSNRLSEPVPVAQDSADATDTLVDYTDVAPLLATRCVKCHTAQGLLGPPPEGFRLDSYAATLASDDRARIVSGQPGASELLRRIKGQARPRMPFDGPPWLSDAEVALIERWIAQGARDSSGLAASVPVGADVRLHGTLSAANAIDGWVFERSGATRIDKNPLPGSYVQLRGTVTADGGVQAERLRRR